MLARSAQESVLPAAAGVVEGESRGTAVHLPFRPLAPRPLRVPAVRLRAVQDEPEAITMQVQRLSDALQDMGAMRPTGVLAEQVAARVARIMQQQLVTEAERAGAECLAHMG